MEAPQVAAAISELFARRGASLYGGEAVSQLEHALQAAWLAEQAGASPAVITAALLHDVGHLLHNLPENAPDEGVDDVHERLGHSWLRRYFDADVCDAVRLHVAAKRYLCAVDPGYAEALSPPSLHSLGLQGGPMSFDEARQFEGEPYFTDCVRVRRWDDAAKTPAMATPPLEHFLSYVAASVRPPVPASTS
jgi:phosphonate degradation associated HDIG domain protein